MKKTGEITPGVTPPESDEKTASGDPADLESHLTKRLSEAAAAKLRSDSEEPPVEGE